MFHRYLQIVLLLALMAVSCSERAVRPRPERPDKVVVEPLYRYFADHDSAAVVARPELTRIFLQVVGFPSDSISSGASMWSNSLPVRVFTPAVDSVYGLEGAPLDSYIGYALAAARLEGLRLPHRTYAAVVYGRREPIGFADSVMFIAMNHYLDPDYPGYQRFPVYERVVKTPGQLPYDIAEALAGTERPYVEPADGATALSRMLYSGALAYARMAMVDSSTEAAALGYTQEQYEWLLEHEGELWRTLLAGQLLYDTDPQTWQKLVSPAPSTPLLSIYSPGRAGRFIGFRMVCRYLERHPGANLAFLLSPEFYNGETILEDIGYGPD